MMRIVHNALRRDLRRTRKALERVPPPGDRQRRAIASHLAWMMAFLEAHHRSEDVGLYPVVRQRDPAAGAVLDEMGRDHDAVAVASEQLAAAAATYGESDERQPVLAAIDELTAALLPHLQREEDEVMPIVSRVVTNAEWAAIEQEHNLDGKSMSQLGREGHWLIDEAEAEDRARVLALVPLVPRLLVLYCFGPGYRRYRRSCWRPGRSVRRRASTAVEVEAGIDAVWDVIRDPTRVGQWSHECVDGTWVGEVTEPRPRSRFSPAGQQPARPGTPPST